ncbi:MAG TPA: RNA polymerase sigma factor [Vicinamibacterales bacterium]|nr:RNA polymerase sigma factor [Vicinamibacterales bacterium]
MLHAADNHQRFLTIVEPNRRRLQGLARSFAIGADRDDLYQEMLLQIWRSLNGFAGTSNPNTWVYRVALNTAISHRRRSSVRERHTAPHVEIDPDAVPGAASGGRDELRILEEFMASLAEIDRALFALYLGDLSYREMAEVTGLSESHVGVRINRMKKRFTDTYIGA